MRVRIGTSTLFSLRLANGPRLSQRTQDIKSFGLVFLYFGHPMSDIPPSHHPSSDSLWNIVDSINALSCFRPSWPTWLPCLPFTMVPMG